ncbi:putative protein YEL023C OS=Saccharomyces cerevisiae (strain ATCC 204508 / S288c) GN=YEL023C PE=4 SV=1 [Rhizoctonia solani AG-1 IB]|uniref:T6SS Phospholipase effector Tle1-like catalytic domain-containing protein n=1 Tax=Thanatephorus cucumeris (strain AG1-IB / isolate 7/3/14) TaxID=1108050 RepID=A0A0B7FT55_THACB|nr:putative protein YEL023C OS=Saccharomyces cerevisiae (strain ATCC 204508 / S288c) GN=YEL023C PE=4 SV=1 [Rhizoctonia solani AG-1 IB]
MERIAWPTRPEPTKPSTTGTEIIVLCDGTGKNGQVDDEPTNIYLLHRLLEALPVGREGSKTTKRRNRKQLYIPGVGAESKGIPKYLALVFGKTIVEMVIKAYMFIAQIYKPGDTVCIFGYSRGAFVARKVAGLLHRVGAVGSEAELLAQWQRREKPVPWERIRDAKHSVPVRCLGVWDTVGAIYSSPECEEKDLLGMPDSELSPNVQLALHIVAYHENRKRFRVTLFEPNGYSELKEIWFPGAHSDVGGGGEKPTDLPKISLVWIVGELREFMDIADDGDELKYPILDGLQPSDAYNDSPAWKRAVDKFETRIDSKALQKTAKVHEILRDIDIKQEKKRAYGTHKQLTFRDLLSLKWNIQTGLVKLNDLELQKRTYVSETMRLQPRTMSLPNFTVPRSHKLYIPSGLQVAGVETESPTEYTPRPAEHRWSIRKRLTSRVTLHVM